MENAAEALQMAAAVLVFILALSITIGCFGVARATSQTVIEYSDREFDYTYVTPSLSATREVNVETIIPTIYKAYKENYKIVFEGIPYLYETDDGLSGSKQCWDIDLANGIVLGSETQKEDFIKLLLYGKDAENRDGSVIDQQQFKNAGIEINSEYLNSYGGLYGYLKSGNKTFKEELGIYYQEESEGKKDSMPDANKMIKREITYTLS